MNATTPAPPRNALENKPWTSAVDALSLTYFPIESLAQIKALLDEKSGENIEVLGAALHMAVESSQLSADVPCAVVTMPDLQNAIGFMEVWQAPGPFRNGNFDCIQYRSNDDVLFASVVLTDFKETSDSPFATARRAYAALLSLIEKEGFPYLVRCWNYFPHINVEQANHEALNESNGLDVDGAMIERYKLFNIGRQEAFIAAGYASSAPAACALGTKAGGLALYCIASRRAPQTIENPRQVSAYRYPKRYGPRSPFFSRASLLPLANGQHTLFLSGTASIVGHESLHIGDVVAQTEESLRNIEVLVEQANLNLGCSIFALENLQYKTFIRHPSHFDLVQDLMRRTLGSSANVLYLEADICRAELLVEIEATGISRMES